MLGEHECAPGRMTEQELKMRSSAPPSLNNHQAIEFTIIFLIPALVEIHGRSQLAVCRGKGLFRIQSETGISAFPLRRLVDPLSRAIIVRLRPQASFQQELMS